MKNILIAIRSIFKKGRHNVMKIVSLGIGLAVGLVLIAKVYFEQSYDDFYPDRDRVYQVWIIRKQAVASLPRCNNRYPRSRPSPDTRVLETGPLR